ncbi:hypothetical protein Asp14428_21440 [Actinoplanes sp. NBRC 14428]|nr:hypothetical protein Asp14428_21440 [Actinoplanes sp. NBRC 14428]
MDPHAAAETRNTAGAHWPGLGTLRGVRPLDASILLALAVAAAAGLGLFPGRRAAEGAGHRLEGFRGVVAVLAAVVLVAAWMLGTDRVPGSLDDLVRTSSTGGPAPDPQLAGAPAVAGARPSVVKVRAAPGEPRRCTRGAVGSGFVYAPEHVLTNAHVVAGAGDVRVESGGRPHDATVVVYDPQGDLAVLYVPGLTAPALPFVREPVRSGADAVVLGFPLDGPYQAQPARIRELSRIDGRDIYGDGAVNRQTYTIRGLVRNGNSGGPLVTPGGRVLGVVFGVSGGHPDLGYALSAAEVADTAAAGARRTGRVGTGDCR